MLIEDIRPHIRFADKLEYTASRPLSRTYDARMLYFIDGAGRISVGGHEREIESGLLVIFQSGVPYKFTPLPSFSAYAIDFDPIGDYDTTGGFFTPLPSRLFDESSAHIHVSFENSEILSTPFMETVRPAVAESIRALVEEYKSERLFSKTRAELMLAGVILDLARRFAPLSKSERTVAKVSGYIAEHYLDPLSNEELARIFGHDPCYLNRIVKEHTGYSIHKLVLKRRVDSGIKLLISTELTLEEIAERCGFCSAAHFSKRCKEITGKNPTYYKKRGI